MVLELSIESLDNNGSGRAIHENTTYCVPFTLIGEVVLAEPVKKTKTVTFCQLKEVKTASPKRILPKCELFQTCGGCHLQHMKYVDQLQFKQNLIEKILSSLNVKTIHPILAAAKPWNYRNRITLHRNNSAIGFFKRSSHDIVPIQHCPIASNALNTKLGQISVDEFSSETHFELRESDESGFAQVNTEQNLVLQDLVASYFQKSKSSSVLELYCGSGNLTFKIANLVKSIEAIEGDDNAIENASQQSRETKHKAKIHFETNDVHTAVTERKQIYKTYDHILLDPPRDGLMQTASLIPSFKAQQIIYVSCNPVSFKRDAEKLISKGYHLENITPLDMFPQTHHVELVGQFIKTI